MREFKSLLVIIGMALLYCVSSSFMHTDYSRHDTVYTVAAGDTMWEIAETYMDRQSKIRDVREMCWEIRQANGLKTSAVQPGQKLIIPLYKEEK